MHARKDSSAHTGAAVVQVLAVVSAYQSWLVGLCGEDLLFGKKPHDKWHRFRKGNRVRLSGLTTSPLLNGAEGRVLEPLGQDGRYAIKLLSPPAAIEAFPQGCRLKPSNMELVQQQQKQQQPKAEQNASSVTVTAPALWSPDSPEAKLIAAAVEDLAKSLDRECYPDKSVESLFGICKDDSVDPFVPLQQRPIGMVVWDVWYRLDQGYIQLEIKRDKDTYAVAQRARKAFFNDVATALMQGCLPAWFEAKVCDLMTQRLGGGASAHFRELQRRGFDKIQWASVQDVMAKLPTAQMHTSALDA